MFGSENVRRYNAMFGLEYGKELEVTPLLHIEWNVGYGLYNKFGCKFLRTSPEGLQVIFVLHTNHTHLHYF